MSSNRDIFHRSYSTHKQQIGTNFNGIHFSKRRPPAPLSASLGGMYNSGRRDSVYGCGDVPGNGSSYPRCHNDFTVQNSKCTNLCKDDGPLQPTTNQVKSSNLSEKDGKSDKRQKLLDWLKKSQAKRDENNRQVFSRWIEKMDNLKAQERDQGSNPTFYCDHLPPPHILYSAINNYQGDAIGNPTVYVGVSQVLYPSHHELIDPQFMSSSHGFLKGSDQFTELRPTSCKEYFFQNDHRPAHNPCCYPYAFTLETMRPNESSVEPTEELVGYAPRTTDQSVTFVSPGTSACCQSVLPPSMMNYSTPTQMMLPVPCIQYYASDSDGANIVPPKGDGINGPIPLVDTKLQSIPMVVGFDQQFCKWIQSTSRHLTPVPPQYPFIQHSDRSTNSNLHTPCNNTDLISSGSDPKIVFDSPKSPLDFEINQWNSLLDDISTKNVQSQESKEQTIYNEVNQSNNDTGNEFQLLEAEGGCFIKETSRDC